MPITHPTHKQIKADPKAAQNALTVQYFRNIVAMHRAAAGTAESAIRGLAQEAEWYLANSALNTRSVHLRALHMHTSAARNVELYANCE